MIKPPKVSIVIPVYNGANYLHEAIDSALAQTYTNIEIIVVNDGSCDDGVTEKIALSYGDKIRYFNKANGGVASALNKAILEMSGEYFSWLSHDDLYFPNKVSSQIDELSVAGHSKNVIYSDFIVFEDNNSDSFNEVKLPTVAPNQFRYFLTLQSMVHGCSLLIPKQAFSICGLFNENLKYTQDYDLWFRMAKQYDFVHVSKCLVKSREHAEQDSKRKQKAALLECNKLHLGFVEKLTSKELLIAEKSLSLAYAKLAGSFNQRNFDKAEKQAKNSAIINLLKSDVYQIIQTILILLKCYLRKTVEITMYIVGITTKCLKNRGNS